MRGIETRSERSEKRYLQRLLNLPMNKETLKKSRICRTN